MKEKNRFYKRYAVNGTALFFSLTQWVPLMSASTKTDTILPRSGLLQAFLSQTEKSVISLVWKQILSVWSQAELTQETFPTSIHRGWTLSLDIVSRFCRVLWNQLEAGNPHPFHGMKEVVLKAKCLASRTSRIILEYQTFHCKTYKLCKGIPSIVRIRREQHFTAFAAVDLNTHRLCLLIK